MERYRQAEYVFWECRDQWEVEVGEGKRRCEDVNLQKDGME